MRAGDEKGDELIFDPRRLTPSDSVDFCGACHRTWWDVSSNMDIGILNLRFAPYRLEKSRCWGKGDRRITCVACHDPHKPLAEDPAFYDQRCLACHATKNSEFHHRPHRRCLVQSVKRIASPATCRNTTYRACTINLQTTGFESPRPERPIRTDSLINEHSCEDESRPETRFLSSRIA